MKVAILAGMGDSCVSEGHQVTPKPMIEIGGRPLIWHIMMVCSHYSYTDFVVGLGYKGEYIKKYFIDYCALHGNLVIDLRTGEVEIDDTHAQSWKVEMVETGEDPTSTGTQVKLLAPYLNSEAFMLAWGDAISNIDVAELVKFHRSHGKLATIVLVHPLARLGYAELKGDQVVAFSEKSQTREGWMNGTVFMLEPEIFDYIEGERSRWQQEPLQRLTKDGQLMAFRHDGFWHCIDTTEDKTLLEGLWQSGKAPWKTWS